MFLAGITRNTTPTEYNSIKQMQLKRFDGTRWTPVGELVGH